MNPGCSNSAFNLRSYVLSLLQLRLVQKNSQSVLFRKGIVEIGGEGFFAIRAAVVNKDIVDIGIVGGI